MDAVTSMTGFGSASFRLEDGSPVQPVEAREFVLDLRSVNHRHAEVKVRLPWTSPGLEARIGAAVRKRFRRGRVDLVVRPAPGAALAEGDLGETLRRVLAQVEPKVRAGVLPGPLTLEALAQCAALQRRGEARDESPPSPEQEAALWRALDAALDGWVEMRLQEGARMAAAVRDILGAAEALLEEIARRVAGDPERIAQRLRERVESVLASLDREIGDVERARLLGEIALLVDRADVTEELVRLRAHFAQARQVLAEAGPHGRKLEFLLQEIHREVNTTGSKASDAEVGRLVVALKAELEKIRELVLNIE